VAIKSLFKTKSMFKRVVVATVTMFFQQWSGEIISFMSFEALLNVVCCRSCVDGGGVVVVDIV